MLNAHVLWLTKAAVQLIPRAQWLGRLQVDAAMCRICRARGLKRIARGGDGVTPAVAFVDASRPPELDPEDDEIPCGFAIADMRSGTEMSVSGVDRDGPPTPSVIRVVVGAGVAGTCCAEELCRLRPLDAVVLVTSGDAVKSVRHVERVTKNVETVHIEEKPATALSHANLSVVRATVVGVDLDEKLLFLETGTDGDVSRQARVDARGRSDGDGPERKNERRTLAYDQLCVCAGAAPRSVFGGESVSEDASKPSKGDSVATRAEHDDALAASITVTVRDVESVAALRARLEGARRVLLVGNGGIAMELADTLCRPGDGEGAGAAKDERAAEPRRREAKGVSAKDGREARSNDDRELVWAARHAAIGDAFFDRDAAAFLRDVAEREGLTRPPPEAERASRETAVTTVSTPPRPARARADAKRARRGSADAPREREPEEPNEPNEPNEPKEPGGAGSERGVFVASGGDLECDVSAPRPAGNAAGPDWTERVRRSGGSRSGGGAFRRFRLRVASNAELAAVVPGEKGDDFPAVAILSDGARVPVDLIVSAAGVDPAPRVAWLPEDRVPRGSDGGIAVDATFRALGDAGAASVFAAGDAACCDARRRDRSTRWFPARLWSQARVSGTYAARVMVGEADADAWGFNFELFTHTTQFFGKKVILLGLYNAQTLESEPEAELVSYSRRDDDASTFARVLLLRGKMVGAVLLGDTDLEETFENLILNGTDLARFGPSLLDPDTDIGDYFD